MTEGPQLLFSSLGLGLFGATMLLVRRLTWSDRLSVPTDFVHLAFGVMGYMLVVTGVAGAEGAVLGAPGLVLLVVIAGVLLVTRARYAAMQRAALLRMLSRATAQGIPAEPVLSAMCLDRTHGIGRSVQAALGEMQGGATLGDALARGGLVNRKVVTMLRAGSDAQALAATLDEVARLHAPRENQSRFLVSISYLATIVIFTLSSLDFMLYRLVNGMSRVIEEFDVEPRPAFQFIQNGLGSSFSLDLFFTIQSLMWVTMLGILAYFFRREAWGRMWEPPPWGRLRRRWNMSLVMKTLAIVAEAGKPLVGALTTLAQGFPKKSFRRRLRDVRDQVEVGASLADCLSEQGLVRRDEGALLQSAERVGNLPWALREIANGIERRMQLRMQAVVQFLTPLLVVALGVAVAWVVVTFLYPMVQFIQSGL